MQSLYNSHPDFVFPITDRQMYILTKMHRSDDQSFTIIICITAAVSRFTTDSLTCVQTLQTAFFSLTFPWFKWSNPDSWTESCQTLTLNLAIICTIITSPSFSQLHQLSHGKTVFFLFYLFSHHRVDVFFLSPSSSGAVSPNQSSRWIWGAAPWTGPPKTSPARSTS